MDSGGVVYEDGDNGELYYLPPDRYGDNNPLILTRLP